MNARLLINPFGFSSATLTPADTAAAVATQPPPRAAAVLIPVSPSAPLPPIPTGPTTAAGSVAPPSVPAAFSNSELACAPIASATRSLGIRGKKDQAQACRSHPADSDIPADWDGVSAQETPSTNSDTQYTSDIPELLARLNDMHKHPCDLDALAANLEKIDRDSPSPDRKPLTFRYGEPPIYWGER